MDNKNFSIGFLLYIKKEEAKNIAEEVLKKLSQETKKIESFLHCDWGWGGSGIGYFSGSVFEVSSHKYQPQNYFAVKQNSILK